MNEYKKGSGAGPEVSHRIVKGVMPKGYRHNDISDLIVAVCRVISSRIVAGKYTGLVSELAATPPSLIRHMSKASSRKDTDTQYGKESPFFFPLVFEADRTVGKACQISYVWGFVFGFWGCAWVQVLTCSLFWAAVGVHGVGPHC